MGVKYRIYPTLIDEYNRFLQEKITHQNLINRINRIRDFDDETLKKMKKGVDFEKAVFSDDPGGFDPEIIQKTRDLLPKNYVTQKKLKFTYKDILFYGFADLIGEKRIVDLKTTSNYHPEKYLNGFQNLYLYALKDKGAESMEYIVYDFKELHHLIISKNETNFSHQLKIMEDFCVFLEENRKLISDKRIFVDQGEKDLFT